MVASNPLFHGRWTIKKFQATVINDIWPEVTFFTLISVMVTLVSKLTTHKLQVANPLLSVLGTVLGLVISFRTSSAYERYQDGRKMWTNITVTARNLAMMIWVHVPTERAGDNHNTLKAVIEKKSMINLIQAYSVALKHFLRGEPGVYYQDLFPLIGFLPRYANIHHHDDDMLPLWSACHDPQFPHPPHPHHPHHHENPREANDAVFGQHVQRTASLPTQHDVQPVEDEKSQTLRSKSLSPKTSRRNTFDPEQALPEIHSARPLRPARNPPKSTIFDYIPVFRFFRFLVRVVQRRARSAEEEAERRRRKKMDTVESNVPFEIVMVLSSYTNFLMRGGLVQPAIATGMMNNITALQDTLSNLDRIRNTPLPFAYQAHLRMSLWLYLLFLPFQIYQQLLWFTIPGTAFAAFLFLGFLEIGQEIENPFNYDLNDLDLDNFCLSLQRELHEITAFTNTDPSSYIFNAWNQPFAPSDRRNAVDLLKDGHGVYHMPLSTDGPEPGMASIRRTLLDSWRQVDEVTRHDH